MATQPSKADRIRKMLHLKNADIAEIIGCDEAYVRAVRQRTSASGNPITNPANKNWVEANRDRVRATAAKRFSERYHGDPEYRAKRLAHSVAYNRERYRVDPEFRKRRIAHSMKWQRKRRAEARAS